MKNIIVIAENTVRETVRDRILYGIFAFAGLYLMFTIFLGALSLGELSMIKSFGLAGIYFFGAVTTIFLGSTLLYKEIERRTLYFILPKPVSRGEVILGKFLGLWSAIAVILASMTAIYLAVVWFEGGGIDYLGVLAVLFQALETAIFVALLIFIAAFTTPLMGVIYATLILFIGHLLELLLLHARGAGAAAETIVSLLYYLLPNLEKFNIRNLVVYGVSPAPEAVLAATFYAVLYSAVLLSAAHALFKRREL